MTEAAETIAFTPIFANDMRNGINYVQNAFRNNYPAQQNVSNIGTFSAFVNDMRSGVNYIRTRSGGPQQSGSSSNTSSEPFTASDITGTVTAFNTAKGYGFINISDDSAKDRVPGGRIFFHVSAVHPKCGKNSKFLQNFMEKQVRFDVGVSPITNRFCAMNVRLLDRENNLLPETDIDTGVAVERDAELSEESSDSDDWEEDEAFPEHFDAGAALQRPEARQPLEDLEIYRPFPELGLDAVAEDERRQPVNIGLLPAQEERDILRNLATFYGTHRELRREAVEMGFSVDLVDRAFTSTAPNGLPKVYGQISELLEELLLLQEGDEAQAGFRNVGFDGTSDDYRFNTWITQAEDMGFNSDKVVEALATREDGITFNTLEELIEAVIELEINAAQPGLPGSAFPGERFRLTGVFPAPIVPKSEAERVAVLKKINQDFRDYFLCKLCMEADAVMVFLPCGHLSCCVNCGMQQELCPYCRCAPTERRTRVVTDLLEPPLPAVLEIANKDSKEVMALLEKENADMQGLRLCRTCKQRDRATYFIPCDHVISCETCSRSMIWCPTCGTKLTKKLPVYFV